MFTLLVHASDHGDERQDECNEHHKSTQKLQKSRLLAKNYQPIIIIEVDINIIFIKSLRTNLYNNCNVFMVMLKCSPLPQI